MTSEADIREKFWKHLKSERTIMLGLDQPGQHSQPMTVQLEGDDELALAKRRMAGPQRDVADIHLSSPGRAGNDDLRVGGHQAGHAVGSR